LAQRITSPLVHFLVVDAEDVGVVAERERHVGEGAQVREQSALTEHEAAPHALAHQLAGFLRDRRVTVEPYVT
jgi:hypothetical protein